MDTRDYTAERLSALLRVLNGEVMYPPHNTKPGVRSWLTRKPELSAKQRKGLTDLLQAGMITCQERMPWRADITHEGRRVLGDWEHLPVVVLARMDAEKKSYRR